MATDDHRSSAPASSRGLATGSGLSHGVNMNVPPGHSMRHAKTFDDTFPMRSGPTSRRFSSDSSSEAPPRRSSNFSEYSLNEARDILNPRPQATGAQLSHHEASPLASLSLAFALLPAIAGIIFNNGSSVVTDVMLLGLAAVFLHWSVTQPWQWYHASRQVRIRQEASTETAVEADCDWESLGRAPASNAPLEDVPEENEEESKLERRKTDARDTQTTTRHQAALKELYRYEVLALLSCFVLPLLSAYLLHAIRSQLSRPSEGLVSNFNLTIFLMASELRVLSHMIKLIHSRTLHLQRVVHKHPFSPPAAMGMPLGELLGRLDRLEAFSATRHETLAEQGISSDSTKASVARDVRKAMQPDLDALNRAVRRYEKKATLLQLQTESRFSDVNARLEDAIALAAAAAKNTASRRTAFLWTVESLTVVLLFPFKAVLEILALPLKPIVALANGNKQQPSTSVKTTRNSRDGKAPATARYSGDRVPARLTKR